MKLAIIGSGVSGLCALKHALKDGYEATVFEQNDKIGGIWNYTDCVGKDEHGREVFTSMYKDLCTNLPKETMELEDFPHSKDLKESYMSSGQFLNYIQGYAKKFNLHSYISFLTKVTNVKPLPYQRWEITTKHIETNVEKTAEFDKVMVCNGHHKTYYIPKVEGLDTFSGNWIHSHHYRVPEVYKGKKVLVVGSAYSACDIAGFISPYVDKLVVSYHSKIFSEFPEKAILRPTMKKVNGNIVTFEDGSSEFVDEIIFATGFLFNFAFLSEDCKIKVNNGWIQYLYKHIINVNHPTMAFIGMPFTICVIAMFDVQVRYALATFKNPNLLPSREEMFSEILEDRKQKDELGYPLKWTHMIGTKHREYLRDLADSAKIKRLPDIVHEVYELSRTDGYRGKRNLYFDVIDHNHFVIRDMEDSNKIIYDSKRQS